MLLLCSSIFPITVVCVCFSSLVTVFEHCCVFVFGFLVGFSEMKSSRLGLMNCAIQKNDVSQVVFSMRRNNFGLCAVSRKISLEISIGFLTLISISIGRFIKSAADKSVWG